MKKVPKKYGDCCYLTYEILRFLEGEYRLNECEMVVFKYSFSSEPGSYKNYQKVNRHFRRGCKGCEYIELVYE